MKLLAALLITVLSLALVDGAAAEPGRGYVVPAHRVVTAEVPAADGYAVLFTWESSGYAAVVVLGQGEESTYGVGPKRVSRDQVAAHFPGYGSFSVDFSPSGPKRQVPSTPGCTGAKTVTEEAGRATGVLRFRGEGGYVELDADEAVATTATFPRRRCGLHTGPPAALRKRPGALIEAPAGDSIAVLTAGVISGIPAPELSVRLEPPAGRSPEERVRFAAKIFSWPRRVWVERTVRALAPTSAFRFSAGPAAPENVAVTPPPPFSGSADFFRTPESSFSWAGDLAVEFPGLAPVPLTGPDFFADLCAFQGCVSHPSDSENRGRPAIEARR